MIVHASGHLAGYDYDSYFPGNVVAMSAVDFANASFNAIPYYRSSNDS